MFRIQDFPDLVLALRQSPIPANEAFSGVSLQRYREAGRQLLPAWSRNVKLRAEEAEPLRINGWHSVKFTYSFETVNAYRKQSVVFVSLNSAEQMVLVTASNEQNFDEASMRMWEIIRTWHFLQTGDGTLAKGN